VYDAIWQPNFGFHDSVFILMTSPPFPGGVWQNISGFPPVTVFFSFFPLSFPVPEPTPIYFQCNPSISMQPFNFFFFLDLIPVFFIAIFLF
jgi:hypothetical protein